jgi:hypothetical protein
VRNARFLALPSLSVAFTGVVVALAAVGSSGCSDLRLADLPPEGGATPDGGSSGSPDGESIDASRADTDAAADGPTGPLYYDDVQAALASKRFPGPTTAAGSKGYCTSSYFVWRETDGTLHSWAPKTQARIDYGFKAAGTRPYFVPSDSFVAVDVVPGYAQIDVFRTDTTNVLVTSIPYALNFVSANDGVIRLDQAVGGVDLGGTKVRRWNAASGLTEDITTVLPTREPPSSFASDTLVIPGGITIPHPLYIVDVVKKTTGSVTFDGAIVLQQTEEGEGGLVVSYVRNGAAGAALRVYKGNQDASRFELGDEVANRPRYLADSPNDLEHKFLGRIATWKTRVLYASAYGIWWYDLVTGALAPLQLVPGKQTAVPDVMCVVKSTGTLVYRMSNDALGQVWAVSLPAGSLL